MTTNREWILVKRPSGMVTEDCWELRESELPTLGEGEALARMRWLSFEPAMRGWMDDRPSYLPPVELGAVMRAPGIAEIIESRSDDYAVGDLVQGLLGWQEHVVIPASGDRPRTLPEGLDPETAMSALGGAALTAYFGLLDIGKPQPGETVVVSGAAGAVGSVVGQIAKLQGCRAIGIAGGPEKCAWVVDTCGFDACIDYKIEDVGERLAELCPDGIDVYFDNVGGVILEAALDNLAMHARIVLCGMISGYNDAEPQPGPRNLFQLIRRRGRMQGFILFDYADRMHEGAAALAQWLIEGKLQYRTDVQHGFENVPRTFFRLFTGENQGKQLLCL
jgi:hypothetical protein